MLKRPKTSKLIRTGAYGIELINKAIFENTEYDNKNAAAKKNISTLFMC